MKLLQRLRCRLGFHGGLNVIQSFGSAEHIGCPRCGRQMGIHHGMRAVIPWESDLEQLYRDMGYDTAAAMGAWQEWRRVKGFVPALRVGRGSDGSSRV